MPPGRIPQNATSLLNAECPAWAGANLVDAPAVAQPFRFHPTKRSARLMCRKRSS